MHEFLESGALSFNKFHCFAFSDLAYEGLPVFVFDPNVKSVATGIECFFYIWASLFALQSSSISLSLLAYTNLLRKKVKKLVFWPVLVSFSYCFLQLFERLTVS